jgi:exodeoxyribonuclease VII small subunit
MAPVLAGVVTSVRRRSGAEVEVAKEPAKKAQDLAYEEVLARLEEVVKRLEAGNLPLEDSLRAFEEGIALVRAGETRLGEAEKRVEQLLATPQGEKAVPFEPEKGAEPARKPARTAREEPPPPGDDDVPF